MATGGVHGEIGDVGLDDVLLDSTMRTVVCDIDRRGFEFKESCEGGRDVTLNAGGGERWRIGVGTIGVGSVRSYAAAGFGDVEENVRGFAADGDWDVGRSSEAIGAVWLRVGC